jgi:hypothetical protein
VEIDGIGILQQTHKILTTVAGDRHTITYAEAMSAIGWNYVNAYQRNIFAYILKAIAYMELGAGHPPLTAVVVSKGDGMPNGSFFSFVREEGRLRKDETDHDYWTREIQRVYTRWASKGGTAS